MVAILIGLLLSSNATGKTLVRAQQGTIVPSVILTKPVIPEDANVVAHLWWKTGLGAQDTRGNPWVMTGTVPQIAKAAPTPAGAGAFSDANYYKLDKLGTGSDVFDFTGDFTMVLVYKCISLVGDAIPIQNGTASATSTAGYFVEACRSAGASGAVIKFMSGGTQSDIGLALAAATESTTQMNVLCMGRSGSNGGIKLNLAAYNQAAAGTITPATSNVMKVGRYESAGLPFSNGTIFELYATTTAVSDASCTAIANTVKGKLGLSW